MTGASSLWIAARPSLRSSVQPVIADMLPSFPELGSLSFASWKANNPGLFQNGLPRSAGSLSNDEGASSALDCHASVIATVRAACHCRPSVTGAEGEAIQAFPEWIAALTRLARNDEGPVPLWIAARPSLRSSIAARHLRAEANNPCLFRMDCRARRLACTMRGPFRLIAALASSQ